MAYDENLASRVRKALEGAAGMSEKRLFGGVAFLLRGNMCCGVIASDLMVRVGPESHADALSRPHARPMRFTGRSLTGFVFVASAGLGSPRALRAWVDQGVRFARSLPAKPAKASPRPAARRPARRRR
jgi:hypothetical protein